MKEQNDGNFGLEDGGIRTPQFNQDCTYYIYPPLHSKYNPNSKNYYTNEKY